ncbi:MAG: D-alanyl-D-alanine carboxypeptidase/D-alanyl-D-alanine-endopeptidase [Phycisphaeraceae bacterium]|nr:D-alanyl-D-alanine carboxypeptidase/D-alanyl-D-alanine-endopeptidase [Phycisphaeraceae bacterium]
MTHSSLVGRILGGLLAVAVSCAAGAADLRSEVAQLIRNARIGGATVGVSIVDMESGAALVGIGAAEPLIPASNMKLLTTGAALVTLGPDFVFRTELVSRDGALIIRGSGDPALADPDMLADSVSGLTPDGLLTALARSAARAGMDRATQIIVDDRVFDREYVHAGWPTDQLDRHYSAPVSGLMANRNVLSFFISQSESGASRFSMEPTVGFVQRELVNRVRASRDGEDRVGAIRPLTENRFTLIGEVAGRQPVQARITLVEAPLFWGRVLAERFASEGVSLSGVGGEVARLAGADESLDGGTPLAVVTTPLVDIVRICNVDSINLYAEALLKRMGHEVTHEPGSWSNGAAVVRMVLADRLGPEAASMTVVSDGSGLSRQDRVAPSVMTGWLASMWHDDLAREPFVASLPTVGEGTLQRRFRTIRVENRVLGKSGTIDGVRALSGYLVHEGSGRALAFSILINDLPATGGMDARAKDLHERIVAAADRWLTQEAARGRVTAYGDEAR